MKVLAKLRFKNDDRDEQRNTPGSAAGQEDFPLNIFRFH